MIWELHWWLFVASKEALTVELRRVDRNQIMKWYNVNYRGGYLWRQRRG